MQSATRTNVGTAPVEVTEIPEGTTVAPVFWTIQNTHATNELSVGGDDCDTTGIILGSYDSATEGTQPHSISGRKVKGKIYMAGSAANTTVRIAWETDGL